MTSTHRTPIGLYKTEVVRTQGPWKTIDDVEYATLEWVDWFNNRRLLAPIGNVPLAEYEQMYYTERGWDCKLHPCSLPLRGQLR